MVLAERRRGAWKQRGVTERAHPATCSHWACGLARKTDRSSLSVAGGSKRLARVDNLNTRGER